MAGSARSAVAGRAAGPIGSVQLLLFSRAPVPGRTKTRLTPPLTPEQARDLHVACLNDLLAAGRDWAAHRAARGGPVVRPHLFITPPASQPVFRRAGVHWPPDWALHNQRGADLGARMEGAIRRVQRRAPPPERPAAVVLVGTDLPLLGAVQWDAAVAALAEADTVFGPTPDGGYYLVATRRDPAGLFAIGDWGGASVLSQSRAAAEAAGHTTALIEPLPDADTADDLRAVLAHPAATSLAGRASLRFIRDLGLR